MTLIRLKEHTRNTVTAHTPTDNYRLLCDESLDVGPFIRRGTSQGFLDTGNSVPEDAPSMVLIGG